MKIFFEICKFKLNTDCQQRSCQTRTRFHWHAGIFYEESQRKDAPGIYYCAQGNRSNVQDRRVKPLHLEKPIDMGENRMGEESSYPLCPLLTVAHVLQQPRQNLSTYKGHHRIQRVDASCSNCKRVVMITSIQCLLKAQARPRALPLVAAPARLCAYMKSSESRFIGRWTR